MVAFFVIGPVLYCIIYSVDTEASDGTTQDDAPASDVADSITARLVYVYSWMALMITGRGFKARIYPTAASNLIALVSWGILATIVDLAYTSMLASSLMVPVLSKPINTWDDALEAGLAITYSVGSFSHAQLKASSEERAAELHKVQRTGQGREIHRFSIYNCNNFMKPLSRARY